MHWLGAAAAIRKPGENRENRAGKPAKTGGKNRGQTTFFGGLIDASAYVTDKRGLSPVFPGF